MQKTIVISFCLLASMFVSAAEPEIKGTPAELANYLQTIPKTVTIAGEGEVKGQADRAFISLRVVTEHRQLEEALQLNQSIRAKIAADLQRHGIEADRIQGSKFASTPKHWIFSEKAKSYRIEQSVKITVKDGQEFQAVANLVDTIQQVHLAGVEPEITDKEAQRRKAVSLALANAAEKKAVYEKSLELRLKPRSFSESIAARLPERMYRDYKMSVQGGSAPRSLGIPALAETDIEESPGGFGEFTYTARVAVEYAVESK